MSLYSSLHSWFYSALRTEGLQYVEQLQTQPVYRTLLREHIRYWSIPSWHIEHVNPMYSSMLSPLLKEELEAMYIVQGTYRERCIVKGHVYILKRSVEPRAWISDIWVHPWMRGGHLGRAIVHELLQLLRLHSVQSVGLEVGSTNQHAIRLYETMGFRDASFERPGCFQKREEFDKKMLCRTGETN